MQKLLDIYNQGLALIPEQYRTVLAVIIIIVLVFSIIKFLRKNFIWIILFLLLLPAAYPAVKQIGSILWGWIQKIPK